MKWTRKKLLLPNVTISIENNDIFTIQWLSFEEKKPAKR